MSHATSGSTLTRRATIAFWLVVAGAMAAFVAVEWQFGSDWSYFVTGADLLHGGHPLDVYAAAPQLQIGPPALALALPLTLLPDSQVVAEAIVAALGIAVIGLLDGLAGRGGRPAGQRLLVSICVAAAWSYVVTAGHLDDALALLGLVAAVQCLDRRHAPSCAVWLAIAVAAKPWAIVALPLLLVFPWREQLRAWVVAALVVTACWAPFVVADPSTVHALAGFRLGIGPGSPAYALGLRYAAIPGWYRSVQLGGAALAAVVAVRCGRWQAALLVALTLRVLLDPGRAAYYGAEVLVGAAVFDICGTRVDRALPTTSLLGLFLVVVPPSLSVAPTLITPVGAVRCAGCLAVLIAATVTVVAAARRTSQRTQAQLGRVARAAT